MNDATNALYISSVDPSAAVIFDRDWLRRTAHRAGLAITRVIPPDIRGMQWLIAMTPCREGIIEVELPPDTAPRGSIDLPPMPDNAHAIRGS